MIRSLILMICAGALLSCEREPVPTTYGPPTTESAIKSARDRMIAKLNPYTIQQGQRVHSIESQQVISSQSPVKLLSKEWVTEVVDVSELETERSLTTHKTVTDKLWDKDFIYKFKTAYSLQKVESLDLLDQLDEKRLHLSSTVANLAEANGIEKATVKGFGYSNLSERRVTLVPPQLVKEAENCKGLPGCRIEADQLTYDIVFLLDDGTTQTFNIEWLVSNQVPFFAGLLKDCNTTVAKIESLRVLVKRCTEVVDFDSE